MLNGPIYPNLVFDFWRKCDVITRADANEELQRIIDQNPIVNKDKTRVELGLRDFKETEIRSSIGGFPVILTRSNLAKMLNLPNTGIVKHCLLQLGRSQFTLLE